MPRAAFTKYCCHCARPNRSSGIVHSLCNRPLIHSLPVPSPRVFQPHPFSKRADEVVIEVAKENACSFGGSQRTARSRDADKAATEFGRNGGHIFLLQLLETEGVDDESDRTRELAATAVEHCMSLCARFPMKAATVDAKNVCDTMRCEIEIDSPLNRCGGVVKVYLRRRSTPNDTAPAPRLICILCLFKRLCLMSLKYALTRPVSQV